MMNVEKLIKDIQSARQEFNRYYQILPVVALEGPDLANGWSAKDLLAHLAAWERYLIDRLIGEPVPDFSTEQAVDDQNYQTYQEYKDWTWEEIEQHAKETFADMLHVLQAIPPQRLRNPELQHAIMINTIDHYAEHLPMLKRWAQQWQQRGQ